MLKRKCLIENRNPKILWEFEVKTDHSTQIRKPYLVPIKKKLDCQLVDFSVPAGPRVKIKKSTNYDRLNGNAVFLGGVLLPKTGNETSV